MTTNRREFLKLTGCCAGALAMMSAPQIASARLATNQRLVVVQLRGGMDGLSVMPDYTSQRYYTMRGRTAVTPPIGNSLRQSLNFLNLDPNMAALDLNGRFGLHPVAVGLKQLFDANEAMLAHGVIFTNDPSYDHFSETAKMANADGSSGTSTPGWVNRLAQVLGAVDGTEAVSMSSITQMVPELQGTAPASIYVPPQGSTIPSGQQLLDFMRQIYARTDFLQLFNDGVAAAEAAQRAVNMMPGHMMMQDMNRFMDPNALDVRMQIGGLLMMAGNFAPNLMVFEDYGWDHHGGLQGNLQYKLRILSRAIKGMRDTLKTQIDPLTGVDYWSNTSILVLSEFGRQINTNAGDGTDHGYGNLMMMFTGMSQNRLPGRGVATWNWGNGVEGDMVQSNGGGNYVLRGTMNGFDLLRNILAVKFAMSPSDINRVFPTFVQSSSSMEQTLGAFA